MRCNQCGATNPPENNFCNDCGHALENACSQCGQVNGRGAKFCGGCAQPLGSSQPPVATPFSAAQPVMNPSLQQPVYPSQEDLHLSTMTAFAEDEPIPLETVYPDEEPQPSSFPAWDDPIPASPEMATPAQPDFQQNLRNLATPIQVGENIQINSKEYALASVEFVVFGPLEEMAAYKDGFAAYKKQCMDWAAHEVQAYRGVIESIQNNSLFIAFPQERSAQASIAQALPVCMTLLQQAFQFQNISLKIRIGLDLEDPDQRNPITATTERYLAAPGQLVFGERVFSQLKTELPVESIGPVRLGEKMVQFYRLTPPVFNEGAIPLASQPEPAATQSPYSYQEPMEVAIPQSQPHVEELASFSVGSVPESPVEQTSYTEPASYTGTAQEVPAYSPPVYGVTQMVRTPNTTYEKAVETMAMALSSFLGGEGFEKKGRVLALCGSDGLGKTNIVHLVRGQIDPAENQDPKAFWLSGGSYSCFKRDELPLYFWLELVQSFFGFSMEGHPAVDAKNHLHQVLSQVFDGTAPTDLSEFLADILSLNPLEPLSLASKENLSRADYYMGQFLKVLARKKPVIIILEDLPLCDTASQDLWVKLLHQGLLDAPIYLILNQTREYYTAGDLQQQLKMLSYKELVIGDLNEQDAYKFLSDGPLAGNIQQIPPNLLQPLIQNAQGLPIYLEEALRMLHMQGVLGIDPNTSKFIPLPQAKLDHIFQLPSLQEMIQKRLAAVSPIGLYVLQLASILGERFSITMLMELAQTQEGTELSQTLRELWDQGFLIPEGMNAAKFRHRLIWQVVYDSIQPELRMQLHNLTSEYLENRLNHGMTVNPMLVAYHAQHGNLMNRAFHYWNLTGVYAAQIGSLVGFNIAMFKALDYLPYIPANDNQENSLRIKESLGVFNTDTNPDLALNLLLQVAGNRQHEQNIPKQIEALGYLANCYENTGNIPQALETLEQTISLLSKANHPLEYSTMLTSKLDYLFTLGHLQNALNLAEQEIDPLFSQYKVDAQSVYFNPYLNTRLLKSEILLQQCETRAFGLIEESLTLCQERDMLGLDISFKLARARGQLYKGQYDTGEHGLSSVLEQIESLSQPGWFLGRWGLIALMFHLERADWNSASMLIPNSLYQSEENRDYITWIMVQIIAGRVAYGLGNLQEAKGILEEAVAQSIRFQFTSCTLTAQRYLAEVLYASGFVNDAINLIHQAVQTAQTEGINNRYELFQLIPLQAQLLIATGEIKNAGKLLEAHWPAVIKTGFSPLIAHMAYGIGDLYKHLAAAQPGTAGRKHTQRAIEFFSKARSLWKELGNTYQIQRVDAAIPAA